MNFLKILPLSQSRLDVLLEIYSEKEDYLRNISQKLKMHPSLTFNILHKLHHSKFIMRRNAGKEVQYSLEKNRDYELLVKILEEYHLEKITHRSKNVNTAITLIINNPELMNASSKIYLYGSYVVGNYTNESDIDILFVNDDRKMVGKICREISIVVGKELNPLIYTLAKFRSELENKEPLLTSIVNNIKNRAIIK